MTNYKKYKSEIEKFACLGISFGFNKKTKKFDACYNIDCEDCMFNDAESCIDDKIKWAYAEYTTPEVDWSKVAIDTPVMVSINEIDWFCRHFARYEGGLIYVWDDGRTSCTTDVTSAWNYAKLLEVE